MVAYSSLKVGDVVYDVRMERAGNTTMRRQAVRHVTIKEICVSESGAQYVIASWNSNPPKRFYLREIERWKRNKPKPKLNIFERALEHRAT